jgi:aspartyl-tRNA(Asn)/glutamyl-tRNA(Gln) amidotransferase subunit A
MDTSTLNAFITPIELRPPVRQGLLSGVRFATKDLIATAGVRTTAGSRILKDWIPKRSAPIVRDLEAAGAVNVGKTNTHEFAFGTTNDNPHYGPTRNPWNPAYTTGGSSGGSAAAVAAGIVPLALGTDTAGSIRIPAALCGCVGFKPGWGVLPTHGIVPLAPTLDTVGFLAATVADAARAFEVVSPRGLRVDRGLRGVVIGVIEKHVFDRVEDEIVASVEDALKLMEKRGATIRRIISDVFDDVLEIGVPLIRSEALGYHRQWFPARRDEYGADVAKSLDAAMELTGGDYRSALQKRQRLERTTRRILKEVDLLAGPAVPVTAFPNRVAYQPVAPGGELPRFALTRLTYPFSLARLPAISVPCGLSTRQLPIGLQLAAGERREFFVLAIAAAYEAALGPFPKPGIHRTL